MRISDWSSDVCSSDLLTLHRIALAGQERDDRGRQVGLTHGHALGAGLESAFRKKKGRSSRSGLSVSRLARTDRKSVVEGKRVSVRVDLGGSRIIKKKKREEKDTE